MAGNFFRRFSLFSGSPKEETQDEVCEVYPNSLKNFILTVCFVLVAVRKDDRFLVIQEHKHKQSWYLPAGKVERGEDFFVAARRETLEEAGIPISFEGILRVEYTPCEYNIARHRVILAATPEDDTPLKCEPDGHSLQARWVTSEELDGLPLRGDEVREIFSYLAHGGTVCPLHLLTFEGLPFPKS